MYMHMCVCVCVCVCVCMPAFMYACVCACACMHACLHMCVCVFVHVRAFPWLNQSCLQHMHLSVVKSYATTHTHKSTNVRHLWLNHLYNFSGAYCQTKSTKYGSYKKKVTYPAVINLFHMEVNTKCLCAFFGRTFSFIRTFIPHKTI